MSASFSTSVHARYPFRLFFLFCACTNADASKIVSHPSVVGVASSKNLGEIRGNFQPKFRRRRDVPKLWVWTRWPCLPTHRVPYPSVLSPSSSPSFSFSFSFVAQSRLPPSWNPHSVKSIRRARAAPLTPDPTRPDPTRLLDCLYHMRFVSTIHNNCLPI